MAKTYTNDISQITGQFPNYSPDNRKNASAEYDEIYEPITVPSTPDSDGKYRIELNYEINIQEPLEVEVDGVALVLKQYGSAIGTGFVGVNYEGIPILEFNANVAGETGTVAYTPIGSFRSSSWENKVEKELETISSNLGVISVAGTVITIGDNTNSVNIPGVINEINTQGSFAFKWGSNTLMNIDEYGIYLSEGQSVYFNNNNTRIYADYNRLNFAGTINYNIGGINWNSSSKTFNCLGGMTFSAYSTGNNSLALNHNATAANRSVSIAPRLQVGASLTPVTSGASIQTDTISISSNATFGGLTIDAVNSRIGRTTNGNIDITSYSNGSNPGIRSYYNATAGNRSVSIGARLQVGNSFSAITSGASIQTDTISASGNIQTGGLKVGVRVVTVGLSPVTLTANDYFLHLNNINGSTTVILPTADVPIGQMYFATIINTHVSATVTFDAGSGNFIHGGPSGYAQTQVYPTDTVHRWFLITKISAGAWSIDSNISQTS